MDLFKFYFLRITREARQKKRSGRDDEDPGRSWAVLPCLLFVTPSHFSILRHFSQSRSCFPAIAPAGVAAPESRPVGLYG
ncbi:hypothetical protein N7468_003754 [Penicillium chermesinum]|uniref:Uncharacterized protein n=1 Tax=Penicillium chermesinum TaxID=63820 RepID=A0A9W9P781_9EURO|nr:uncharacterized protein N7468_003754 [Penicillium chermesinum]KAJ5239135.1 hypothetical protein N7468_003754 [Penicillium chermesinum]